MSGVNKLGSKQTFELISEREVLLRELISLRMQVSSGHAVKTHLFGVNRRAIARINTVLMQRSRGVK